MNSQDNESNRMPPGDQPTATRIAGEDSLSISNTVPTIGKSASHSWFFRVFRVFRGSKRPMTIRRQGILLFCILMFCYAYVHQHMGWNQNSRLDLLHALFVHKTFKIDAYHENTGDKSVHNGHYYSDKAPGIVFLAIPAFAVSVAILDALDIPLDSPRGWLASSWITTVGSVGLITALGGVAMFVFLCRLVEARYAFLTTYVVFLGAAPFPYATMLFSHAAVIGLICIALWAIADDRFLSRMLRTNKCKNVTTPPDYSLAPIGRGGQGEGADPSNAHSQNWSKRYILAGVCCGLAVASEYTAALAAGAVLALATCVHYKRGLVLALAAIPALLLILIYNWLCFGGPLAFGYHHLALAEFQEMNKGLFGITFPPKATAAYLILLSPERGLFFWTPFLLLALVGWTPIFYRWPKLFWTSYAVVVVHVLCISGYYMPDGGAALGPRHLAPILPFLGIAAAFSLPRCKPVGAILGYYSILLTGFGTLINAMPQSDMPNPLLTFYLPQIADGKFTHNLAYHFGLHGWLSICLVIAIIFYLYCMACFRKNRAREIVR